MVKLIKLSITLSLISALAACGSTTHSGRIAVNLMQGGDWDVIIFDLETEVIYTVTDNTTFDWGARWSPDGTTLALTSQYLSGEFEDIVRKKDDGTTETINQEIVGGQDIVVTTDGEFSLTHLTEAFNTEDEAAWSPDGKRLAFQSDRTGDVELFTMDADGSNVVQLTESAGEDWHPDWSPDGSKIAFVSNRDLVGDQNANWDIYVMEADGSNVKPLTQTEEDEWRPVWSPDGQQLAFAKRSDESAWDLFVMDTDGNNIVQLTDDPGNSWEPVWSPDGKQLAFGSNRTGDMEVYLMNADGSQVERLKLPGIPSDWTAHD